MTLNVQPTAEQVAGFKLRLDIEIKYLWSSGLQDTVSSLLSVPRHEKEFCPRVLRHRSRWRLSLFRVLLIAMIIYRTYLRGNLNSISKV